jgi:cytochrome oxidase Cu insertion factor (SCO1/SenC/PrrC family)
MNALSSTDGHAERCRTVALPVAKLFRRLTIRSSLVLVLLMCFVSVGVAQQDKASERAQRPNPKTGEDSPRERVNRKFESNAPGIGEPLPDITVLDADGREFSLRSLRGEYTVLVFGCLT